MPHLSLPFYDFFDKVFLGLKLEAACRAKFYNFLFFNEIFSKFQGFFSRNIENLMKITMIR